ncbi:MAG: hypothetical protein MZV63_10130 [Marinilabiliales bacterium]|nr:hypothetical protein [Marinilabiliales bacterium]
MPLNNGFLLPGDMIMLDFNSDGRYYNTDDDVPYGYPTYPQNNYGISFGTDYKGFEFVGKISWEPIMPPEEFHLRHSASSGACFYYDNTYAPTCNSWRYLDAGI